MKIAQQVLERFDLEHALAILNQYIPKPGDTNDLRDFVWRYEWQLCQGDPHDILPQAVAFPWSMEVSPDGQYLALGSTYGIEGSVVVWRIATKEIVAHLERDPSVEGDVSWAAFTSDGKMLVTACHRRVKFFDTATWAERPELTITNVSGPIDIRGDTLVTMAPGYWHLGKIWKQLKIWNLQTRTSQTLTNVDGPPTLAPDGKRLVLNSPEGLKVWHTDRLEAVPQFLAGSSNLLTSASSYQGLYRCLAFSPDGKTLITCGGDKELRWWDFATGQLVRSSRLSFQVTSLALSPDGATLVCASGQCDQETKQWSVFRPDGLPIRIWRAPSLTEIDELIRSERHNH